MCSPAVLAAIRAKVQNQTGVGDIRNPHVFVWEEWERLGRGMCGWVRGRGAAVEGLHRGAGVLRAIMVVVLR